MAGQKRIVRRMSLFTALTALLCVGRSRGLRLHDHRVGGVSNSVISLDGSGWLATRLQPGAVSNCTFEQNVDFNHGSVAGGWASAADGASCCHLCGAKPGCAAGEFYQGQCWFKSESDLAKKSHHDGGVACFPQRSEGRLLRIGATVPGDVITDIWQTGMINDPLYELTFKTNASLWTGGVFNYSTTFNLTDRQLRSFTAGGDTLLVFDGIKMGAHIYVNGHLLGTATDQFLRYIFSLSKTHSGRKRRLSQKRKHEEGVLREGGNELVVSFDSEIDTMGRFMACSGGWDWAPYSFSREASTGARTFSRGIWKSVYLVDVAQSSAAILHVVPQIFYLGEYPVTPLQDGNHGGFHMDVNVWFYVPSASKGTLTLTTEWGGKVDSKISLPAGEQVQSNLSLIVKATDIKLWWPNGLGRQALYNVTVMYTATEGAVVESTRRVGFRFVALVTGNDTDPEYVKNSTGAEGTSDFGMFFRVNGAAIFSRGGNMIPMDEMEGRFDASAHAQLVQSAAEGHFNMLRVWGGGVFLPEAWYDTCDEAGVMVYHDMQYAQQGHAPVKTDVQDAELRHQVRRLAHHASIVIWDGCNECRVRMGTPTGIYVTFVMSVVAEEDKSRPIWPSCPALGWTTGVHRLTSLPNGKALTTPSSGKTIETHGPYQVGSGFPTVELNAQLKLFDANIPIKVHQTPTGVAEQSVFASEFGCAVMSSYESMIGTLNEKHFGLHGGLPPDVCTAHGECEGPNPMSERNHPCDSIIQVYFGAIDFNASGLSAFQKQLFLCMVGQALYMKSAIETRRASNQHGIIVWQFNEIWPTGGWGSVEYGSSVNQRPIDVLGGRWKPLHYFFRKSLFTDLIIACGADDKCYVKNDSPLPASGTVELHAISLLSAETTLVYQKDVELAVGPGEMMWFVANTSSLNTTTEIIRARFMSEKEDALTENDILLTTPEKLQLSQLVEVRADPSMEPNPDGTLNITLSTDHPALFVTLTTIASGRFSENCFLLLPPSRTILFIPFGEINLKQLWGSLRVEHLAMYM